MCAGRNIRESQIADLKIEAEKVATVAAEAKYQAERLKRGEDVASGLTKPDWEKWLRERGRTTRDTNHARLLSEISNAFGTEEVFKLVWERRDKAGRREEMRRVRGLKTYLDQKKLEQ